MSGTAACLVCNTCADPASTANWSPAQPLRPYHPLNYRKFYVYNQQRPVAILRYHSSPLADIEVELLLDGELASGGRTGDDRCDGFWSLA